MFIDLEPVFNNVGFVTEIDYSFSVDDVECIKEPVKVKGKVENKAGIVTLSGLIKFEISALCDRCAEEFTREMSFPFTHVLISKRNEEENDDFILVEKMRMDLDELLREDIILSLPTQLLCKEDCKGLCQMCGQNLNYKQCGCKKPVDPRLAVLQQFLEDN